jgi:PilZ domain
MAAVNRSFPIEAVRQIGRRQDVMLGVHPEQRTSVRYFTTAPAVVRADGANHVGLVRDLSGNGLFLYSDFKPDCGSTLQLTLNLREEAANESYACRGKVVRVVAATSGAAIGIAVELEEYEAEDDAAKPEII